MDQINDVTTGRSFGCGAPPMGLGSLFQSFTPSASLLMAVDLRLRVGGGPFPSEGFETTINIRSDNPAGTILGTATTLVPGPQNVGTELEVRFDLSPGIAIAPGDTYVIEWISPPEGGVIFTWMGADDSYPGGTAFGCSGDPVPQDLIFTTFTN